MKIFQPNNPSEIKKEDLHYCPFCKLLFFDDKNYTLSKKNKVTCHNCKKKFLLSEFHTIAKDSQNLHSYSLPKDLEITITPFEYIQQICQKYYDDGFSYRDIHKITFFSLELIQKCIAVKKTFDKPRTCTEEQLLNKYLKIKEKDTQKDKIKKALEFGCNYIVIEKLFKVSSKTIIAVKKELNKKSQEPKKERPLMKVSFKNNEYIFSKVKK